MKWYTSIKVKLIGFFLIVSLFFLLFLVLSFSVLKESYVKKSAVEQARLSTIGIVDRLTNTQIKMEGNVAVLASLSAEKYKSSKLDTSLILSFMNAIRSNDIPSGGVWFEPYVLHPHKKEGVIFFHREDTEKFTLIEDYILPHAKSYREMEFYVLGKQLKKGETFWTKVYIDPVTSIRMITVVSPIYQGDTFIGVASIDMEVKYYTEWFTARDDRYMMVLDRSGTFIVKSPCVERMIPEKNIYNIEGREAGMIASVIKQGIERRKENAVLEHATEAESLFKSSFEIDRDDAKMIISIMHHPKSMIETTTHFIKKDPVLHQESVLATFYFTNTGMSLVVGISKDVILKEINKDYNIIIWITLLITILATILGYFLLKKYFVLPLESVNEQLENSMLEDGHYRFLECKDKGEIGQLVYNLNSRTLALEDAQRREKEEIQKRLTNEKLLIQQSKMAAMGEMMDAVAHQWKQPLNALSMYSEIIRSDFEEGSVDQKYVDEFSKNIQIQIDHMVDTLDEFRSFFRPNKENEVFTVSKVIDSVLFLTKDEFMKNRIMVTVEIENEIELLGSKNEFKHLILNIINNAKDAFNDNDIQEKRIITIRLFDDEKGKKIEIEDNAGGIPEDVLPDIFKANVTTKEEGKGTGIGLYMSTQIAEKYGAELLVENLEEGACFTILFKA